MTGQLHIFDDASQVARAAADRFVKFGLEAIEGAGKYSVALAGGSTPKRAYQLLASDEYKTQIDWSKVHIFFGDERCVSPEDPQSNYRMANEAMLSRVSIPPQNVHRIRGLGDAVSNAGLYEDELRTYFNDADWPRFDLVFLGMGDDGHTASLFPDSPALYETEALVSANWIAKFDAYRITLTAPAINHAAHIAFLVTGENKAKRLAEIVNSVHLPKRLPVQLINPVNGSLEWLVDKSAAAGLPQGDEVNNRDGAAQ